MKNEKQKINKKIRTKKKTPRKRTIRGKRWAKNDRNKIKAEKEWVRKG